MKNFRDGNEAFAATGKESGAMASQIEQAKEDAPTGKSEEDAIEIEDDAQAGGKGRRAYKKRDVYQETTDKIIAMLENGSMMWQSGWDKSLGQQLMGLPLNGKTNRAYTSLNRVYLSMIMADKHSSDPRFFTMAALKEQNRIHRDKAAIAKEQGKPYSKELDWEYRVKKGTKSIAVYSHWKVRETFVKRDGKSVKVRLSPEDEYWAKKTCLVFHASDCIRREYERDKEGNLVMDENGKPKYTDHPLKEWKPKAKGYTHAEQSEICEAILKASGAKIYHDVPSPVYSDPCYAPKKDEIHLPPKETFSDINEYYATALHELCHWTGHESRMNRPNASKVEDREEYAKEELRAELASTFLSIDLGIPMNTTNHAAYVKSWVKALRDDKKEISKASMEAKKIANYVKKFMPEKFRKKEDEFTPAPEGVIGEDAPVQDVVVEVPASEAEAAPVKESGEPKKYDPNRLTHVDDSSLATLPEDAKASGTAVFYRYLTKEAALPFKIPSENLSHVERRPKDRLTENGDAVYYSKQLSASEAAKYDMQPDYRYFANKSVHIAVYQQTDGEAFTEGAPRFLRKNYEKTCEGNFVRTGESSQVLCGKVFEEMATPKPEGERVFDSARPLKENDLIEVDGQLWNVDKSGFSRMQLNRYENDLVITPLPEEQVKAMLAEVERSVGKEAFAGYRQKFREMSYISSQTDGSLAVHPGAFQPTDEERDTMLLAMQRAYAKGFRDNAIKEGLSIYTPMDEKGWKKLDFDFAKKFYLDAFRGNEEGINLLKSEDPAADMVLTLERLGDVIHACSPYSAITQDEVYGHLRAIEAMSAPEVEAAYRKWEKEHGDPKTSEKVEDKEAATARTEAAEECEEGRAR